MEKRKRQIAENIHQAAYKKGRSTQEHILRLAEDVNHAFAKQECVIAVFLDVSGAFDRVWISGLMWKLLMMRLPINLLCVIKGFLTNRSLRVKVDKIISDNVNMAAGTAQGAVLTILFKTRVRHVLSHCIKMVKKTMGKPVSLGKLFKNAVKCRQAERCSSIRLDFRAKRVKVFTLNNADKIDKNFCAKFWHVFFIFSHISVTGA